MRADDDEFRCALPLTLPLRGSLSPLARRGLG